MADDWTDWNDHEDFTYEGWLTLGGNYPSFEGQDSEETEPWQPRSVLDPLDGAQFDHAMFGNDSEWTGMDPFYDGPDDGPNEVGAAQIPRPTSASSAPTFAPFRREGRGPLADVRWVEVGVGALAGVLLGKLVR